MHQPVTLWIQQASAPFRSSTYRPIHGFVHRAGILGDDGDLAVYQIEFASALFFLGHARDDHYWLEKDAREILLDVLNRYPIVQGSSQYMIEGRAVALDGMKTACGASLIASQQEFMASE